MSTEDKASNSGSAPASDDRKGIEADGQKAEGSTEQNTNDQQPAVHGEQHQDTAVAGDKSQPTEGQPRDKEPSKLDAKFAELTGKTRDGKPAEDAEKSNGAAAKADTSAGGNKKQGDDDDDIPVAIKGNEKDAGAWRDLRKRAKQVKELEPFAKVGRQLVQTLNKHGLADEVRSLDEQQVAQGLALEASLSRIAAGKGTKQDQERLEAAWKRAGTSRQQPPAEVPAFTGELPHELRDAVEMQYLSEEDARALMALRQAKTAAKAKPAEAKTKEQETPAEKPPVREDPAAIQAQVRRLETVLADSFVESGVPENQLKPHITETLMPRVLASIAKTSPGEDPDAVWESFDPQTRFELLTAAHQAHLATRVARGQDGAGQDGKTGARTRQGPIHQGDSVRQGSRRVPGGQDSTRSKAAAFERMTGRAYGDGSRG